LIPFVLFGIFSYNIYKSYLIDEIVSITHDNTSIIRQQIEKELESIEDASNNLTLQLNVIFDNYNAQSGDYDRTVENEIYSALYGTELSFNSIDSVAYIDVENNIYASNGMLTLNSYRVKDSSLLERAKTSNGESIWIKTYIRDFLVSSNNLYFTMVKKVIDLDLGTTHGYIVINVSEETISEILKTDYAHFVLVNDGFIISSNDKEELVTKVSTPDFNGETYVDENFYGVEEVYVRADVSELNWQIVGKVYLEGLNDSIQNIWMLIVLSVLVIVLLIILVARRASLYIVSPINKLKESVQRIAEHDFETPVTSIDSNDEVGLFAKNFDSMRLEIKHLLSEIEEKEKEKREYELALIFEQLKPHFLYNTLDTIAALTEMGRKKQSLKAINQLASFYRKTLNSGLELINIYDEVELIKNYLYIQQLQYSDQFDFEIEVVDDLNDYVIPKLTLQPIVENALYHGLNKKQGIGHLLINVWDDDEFVYLTVHDNGAGFDERLKDKLNAGDFSDFDDHFGVRCIVDRLQLHFGNEASYTIRSEKDEYTLSIVKIPKRSRFDD
jgi:two-component system sensor histidine kinase YesM